jgi:hypothetical protein
MRWIWTALIWLSAVAIAAPVAAQQSLGDVAGSIKLKRTGDNDVVIDQTSVGRSRSISSSLSDGQALLEATKECATAAQTLSDLLGETGSGEVFYDDGWRTRVEAAGGEWDQSNRVFEVIYAQDQYEAPYDTAERGATATTIGLGILRGAISNDQPLFGEAKRQIAEGAELLESAERDLSAALRREEAESPPPPIDPIAADRSIEAVCRKSGAEGSQGFDSCVAEQQAAMDAIMGRYAPSVRLDQATFNKIRNSCLYEWPDDFVSRNLCERQRIGRATR